MTRVLILLATVVMGLGGGVFTKTGRRPIGL